MLIDIHTHTCYPRGVGQALGWTFIDPEAFVAGLDERGIDKAALLPIMSPDHQKHYIPPEEALAIRDAYPGRIIPFCCLDGRMMANSPESDFRKMLEYYKEQGCKGVGEYVTNLPFDDPLQMNVFRQVEEVGLPLTFHVGASLGGCYGCYDEPGLPRLEKVLQACPSLKLLGHSPGFWSEIDAGADDRARRGYPHGPVTPGRLVELMRTYPNLYGDLSAGSGYNAVTRDPDFGLAFMEEFQDRLLFGTDLCWPDQETPIVEWFAGLVQDGALSGEAHEKIAWKNADRLLGLGIAQTEAPTVT
jgi:hypothetical protein